MNTLPLISGHMLDDILAWRPDGPVNVREFIADARMLAARLPAGDWLLNVCQDRYRFAVGFAAGLLSGKASLQPASQSPETLAQINTKFPCSLCLCDSDFDHGKLQRIDFPVLSAVDREHVAEIPGIAAEQIAAILFTSGSTGLPQAHQKSWGKLVANGLAGAAALALENRPHAIVGTVPVQHSYGFESTLLLALHGRCSFWAGKPFYPQDIASALAAVPQPRLLVSTPFHLSALLAAEIPLPDVDMLLSATAPLSGELAAKAEARTGAPLHEIYGSTETGQIAVRRTTAGPDWALLPDIELRQEGEYTLASGGHIEGEMTMGDRIDLLDARRFTLLGRHADLINIAGKRTSLAYLNHQIAAIPGVVDACFYLPDEEAVDGITRLAAFVVAPELSSRDIQAALRQRIDAVFMPRPLIRVDALPRNSTGKLPRAALQALHQARTRHE